MLAIVYLCFKEVNTVKDEAINKRMYQDKREALAKDAYPRLGQLEQGCSEFFTSPFNFITPKPTHCTALILDQFVLLRAYHQNPKASS